MKLVTLASDFEKQSQGVANMEGVVYAINPGARVVHLMHGIPGFNVIQAARTMETSASLTSPSRAGSLPRATRLVPNFPSRANG